MQIINRDKFKLPTSGDFYNTLKNTIAPNFSFTQSDLYSAIAQVYLYLDGVPTLDENGVLGIEYFNDNNSSLKYQDSPNDIVKTVTEDRYANGLITDFQKGDKDTPLVFPCKNGLAITQCLDIGATSLNDSGTISANSSKVINLSTQGGYSSFQGSLSVTFTASGYESSTLDEPVQA